MFNDPIPLQHLLPWNSPSLAVLIFFLHRGNKARQLIILHFSFILLDEDIPVLHTGPSSSYLFRVYNPLTLCIQWIKFVSIFGVKRYYQKYLRRLVANMCPGRKQDYLLKFSTRALASHRCSWESGLVCLNGEIRMMVEV